MKPIKPPTGPQVENANPDEVFAVITAAASQDPTQIKNATDRLKELLDMFGTLDTLQAIACQRNLPLAVRLQSAIQFKNAVINRWRSRKLLNDEHRQRIRERCLQFTEEEADLVSVQNEEVIRKIARQDFPTTWPNLLPDLLGSIDRDLKQRYVTLSDDPLVALRLRRSLRMLGDILEEFAAYKLLAGVRTMSEIVRQYARILLTYFTTVSSNCIPPAITLEAFCGHRTQTDLVNTRLLFICVHHITTWLWCRNERPGKEIFVEMQDWFYEAFRISSLQLNNMVEVRKQLVQFKNQHQGLDNGILTSSLKELNLHIRELGHCFRRMQQFSTAQFCKVDLAADVVLYGWSQVVEAGNAPPEAASDSEDALYYIPFLIQAMVLFKDSLSQFAPTIKDKEYKEVPNPRAFSQQFVESAVTLLVTRFIPLKPADLETWVNDPEEWFYNEDPDHERWELELRPCSERLLVTFSIQETRYVINLLISTFNAMASQRADDLNSVIQKEALYTAIGRCAHRLKGEIDFDNWLQNTLVPEARETNANYPIIKRRIAWFLGKWIAEGCALANNTVIWDILVHLLHDRESGTDSVVRLTAALALRECIDTIDFSLDSFIPYLSVTVGDMIQLLAEASGTETKRSLCKALNVVVERAGTQITPFATAVAQSIQPMWIDAGDEWLLKGSLLDVVTSLTRSIGTASNGMWGLIVPIIQECLSPPASQNLDSDGLTLWGAALQSAGAIENSGPFGLLQLMPILIHLLENNMDLLGQITSIAESYYFLDPLKVTQQYAQPLLSAYMACIKHKPLEINLRDILRSLTFMIRFSPPLVWGESFHTSGLFPHFIHLLVDGESGTQVLKEVIYILCRISLADPKLFLQLMASAAQTMQKPEAKLWEFTLDQWSGRFDNMAEPQERKLAAMGIAALVSTGHPELLQRLASGIFDIWVDVLYETREAQQQHEDDGVSSTTLTRFWEEDEPPHSYYGDSQGTTEEERRTAMWKQDILRTTKLSTCIRDSMAAASAVVGDVMFQQYMAKADPTMLKQLLEQVQS